MAENINRVVAKNGVPVSVSGTKKRGRCFVNFFHRCCDCGLRHDVTVEHDGKTPDIDITFNRLKKDE